MTSCFVWPSVGRLQAPGRHRLARCHEAPTRAASGPPPAWIAYCRTPHQPAPSSRTSSFDLIVDAGFVRPEVNRAVLLEGRRVVPDFRWPEQRIVVEADSRTWHDNPIARADDAERQTLLEARGDRVLRVTWTQAISTPR